MAVPQEEEGAGAKATRRRVDPTELGPGHSTAPHRASGRGVQSQVHL